MGTETTGLVSGADLGEMVKRAEEIEKQLIYELKGLSMSDQEQLLELVKELKDPSPSYNSMKAEQDKGFADFS